MKHLELRNLMLQNKPFLRALFESQQAKNTKKLLLESSEEQANLLIRILFFITQGEIPIKKQNFEILEESKKLLLLHKHFQTELKLNKLLTSTLQKKIIILFKFVSVFHNLLYPLFK